MATDNMMTTAHMAPEQGKAFNLSSDPNKAMQQMMDMIDSLREVYVEENTALETADTRKFMGLQNKKIEAARDYQNCAAQLRERKDDLQHIDVALKEQLKSKQEEFSGIMAENLKSLDRLRKGVKRLNDRIMVTARETAQKKNVNYGSSGNLEKNERAVSIGVSESA